MICMNRTNCMTDTLCVLGRRLSALGCAALFYAGVPLATLAQSATPPAATPAPACETPGFLEPARLSGLWQLTLWPENGSPAQAVSTGAVLFERHPEYEGSVRGRLKRSDTGNDREAVLSGDVVDGEVNFDESADGVNLDAVWIGEPAACGLELRGSRRPADGRPADAPVLNFLLKKAPGWR